MILLDNLSIDLSIRMIFALSGKMETNFLSEVEKHGIVRLDNQNRIIEYVANDGKMKLKGQHDGRKDHGTQATQDPV